MQDEHPLPHYWLPEIDRGYEGPVDKKVTVDADTRLYDLALKALCRHIYLKVKLWAYLPGTFLGWPRVLDLMKEWWTCEHDAAKAVRVTLNGVDIPRELAPSIVTQCHVLSLRDRDPAHVGWRWSYEMEYGSNVSDGDRDYINFHFQYGRDLVQFYK